MTGPSLSFLTPYWSGEEMMRVHLTSIRRFHPDARIIVSKKGGGAEEMEGYAREFGVEYRLEECSYTDAYFRLLGRCRTRYVCFLDHDAVLLAPLTPYLEGLEAGAYDLVGVEERIREAPASDWQHHRPGLGGWLRYAPGQVASNVLLFDWERFRRRFGIGGVIGRRTAGALHYEFDYGIGQRLPRHRYLVPYHTARYGLGNLLCDGDRPVAWHQWYGAFRARLGTEATRGDDTALMAARGEAAFLTDQPDLDLAGRTPAWGPGEPVPPSPPAPPFWRERLHLLSSLGPLTLAALLRDLPRSRRTKA